MEKALRPKSLMGKTITKMVGCGEIDITINRNGKNPFEIFTHLGKAGGCSGCQNEALTRCITMGLRYGIPAEEYAEELRGIRCPNPKLGPPGERYLSCPDAIGAALREYLDASKT